MPVVPDPDITLESQMNINDDSKTNTDMKAAISSSPAVAVIAQEGIDGLREKAMRIASVEQRDSIRVMDMSVNVKGDMIVWAVGNS